MKREMNDYKFGTIVSFAGMFLLMGFDYTIGSHSVERMNIAFLIPLMALLVFGSYNGVRFFMVQEKLKND